LRSVKVLWVDNILLIVALKTKGIYNAKTVTGPFSALNRDLFFWKIAQKRTSHGQEKLSD